MNLISRNFIILYLIVCILGAFGFHWFFVDKMMSINECLSTVYHFSQLIPQQITNILLVVLTVVLFALVLPLMVSLYNRFNKIPGKIFLKWKIDGFCHKLISWLKILERRDPHAALIAVRISDLRQ